MQYDQRNKEEMMHGNIAEEKGERQSIFAGNHLLSKLKLDFKSIFEGNRRFHLIGSIQQQDEINS